MNKEVTVKIKMEIPVKEVAEVLHDMEQIPLEPGWFFNIWGHMVEEYEIIEVKGSKDE